MNIPTDFINRMKSMLGDEFHGFYEAFLNAPSYTALRLNTLKTNSLPKIDGTQENVEWCKNGFYCDKSKISGTHPYHMAGLFYFQEPSAMATVEAADISEGDFVLDLCAAPGGKSTQAAAKLCGKGLLIANEIIQKRAQILSENIERMGIKNAIVTNESPQKLEEKYPLFFDKIIVDAPCSGEGMFRKEELAASEWSIEHTKSCGARQKNILDSAVKMLNNGGTLIYSTCTFAPEENEQVAEYLIFEHGLIPQEPQALDMLSCGRAEWSKNGTDMSFSRRIFPHIHKGEGHFVAVFKKPDGENITNSYKEKKPDDKTVSSIKLYRDFEKANLNISLDGHFKLFGDNLYLLPYPIDIDRIKVLRYGLHLGTIKKNRFEPAHALALSLSRNDFKNAIDVSADSNDANNYMRGHTLECNFNGYGAICVDTFPLGWGKASNGVFKNHYPKHLRLPN